MKHWDRRHSGKVVKLRPSWRDRRRLYEMFDVGPARRRRDGSSATTIGVVLAMAVCAGLAWGLAPPRDIAGGPDKPILWDETQAVPQGQSDQADTDWVARGQEGDAPRPERSRAGVSTRSFGFCHTGGGTNCVVDGDTFYMGGEKIRIADIDAPETHDYGCASEAERGQRATRRLQDLLNSGGVQMASIDRDTDVYGRKLRIVEVNGAGVGETLVDEGLARWYGGGRRSWC